MAFETEKITQFTVDKRGMSLEPISECPSENARFAVFSRAGGI